MMFEQRLQKFHTDDVSVVVLIGRIAWKICFNQSEALPRSGYSRVIAVEFLRLFVRRHFAGNPVVASRKCRLFSQATWGFNRYCIPVQATFYQKPLRKSLVPR